MSEIPVDDQVSTLVLYPFSQLHFPAGFFPSGTIFSESLENIFKQSSVDLSKVSTIFLDTRRNSIPMEKMVKLIDAFPRVSIYFTFDPITFVSRATPIFQTGEIYIKAIRIVEKLLIVEISKSIEEELDFAALILGFEMGVKGSQIDSDSNIVMTERNHERSNIEKVLLIPALEKVGSKVLNTRTRKLIRTMVTRILGPHASSQLIFTVKSSVRKVTRG